MYSAVVAQANRHMIPFYSNPAQGNMPLIRYIQFFRFVDPVWIVTRGPCQPTKKFQVPMDTSIRQEELMQ